MVIILRGSLRKNNGIWTKILCFWPCYASMPRRYLLLNFWWLSSYFRWRQNLILPSTKPIRWWTEVEEGISARHISRIGSTTQCFDTNLHIFPRPFPWNCDGSTQNLILHPIELTRKPWQVEEQTSARHTSRIGFKTRFWPKFLYFS
jgi:hypothetical protein